MSGRPRWRPGGVCPRPLRNHRQQSQEPRQRCRCGRCGHAVERLLGPARRRHPAARQRTDGTTGMIPRRRQRLTAAVVAGMAGGKTQGIRDGHDRNHSQQRLKSQGIGRDHGDGATRGRTGVRGRHGTPLSYRPQERASMTPVVRADVRPTPDSGGPAVSLCGIAPRDTCLTASSRDDVGPAPRPLVDW